ncbi:hypothetical protein AHF37_04748 [Paragonimus kellicotti]|nr:hypothetical protein AHF37_04748 [Paragonimus kellicotti]
MVFLEMIQQYESPPVVHSALGNDGKCDPCVLMQPLFFAYYSFYLRVFPTFRQLPFKRSDFSMSKFDKDGLQKTSKFVIFVSSYCPDPRSIRENSRNPRLGNSKNCWLVKS